MHAPNAVSSGFRRTAVLDKNVHPDNTFSRRSKTKTRSSLQRHASWYAGSGTSVGRHRGLSHGTAGLRVMMFCTNSSLSVYRYGDQVETEEVVGGWLRATIKRQEEERAAAKRNQREQPSVGNGGMTKGTPLNQKQHPKCANPACPTAFHWTGGDKFFRFRPDPDSQSASGSERDAPPGIHGGRHY